MPLSITTSSSSNGPNPTSVITTTSIAGGPSSSVLPIFSNLSTIPQNVNQGRVLPVFHSVANSIDNSSDNISQNSADILSSVQIPSSALEPQSPLSYSAGNAVGRHSYFEGRIVLAT